MSEAVDFTIENLGERKVRSPIIMPTVPGGKTVNYVADDKAIRLAIWVKPGAQQPVKKNRYWSAPAPGN